MVSAQIRRISVIRGLCATIKAILPNTRDEYDYTPFFENLKQIGYEGRISIETGAPDISNKAPQSITFLRAAFSQ